MQPAALFTQFTRFTLMEYLRSGRVLIELSATVAMFLAAIRGRALDAEGFFANAALFSLVAALYTGSTIIGLGDRPHGYLLVIRPLGRTGYLVGLYSAILIVVVVCYALLCLLTAIAAPVEGMGVRGWLAGSVPLLLNVALLSALLSLLAPFVLPPAWRLAVLALVALAFSSSLLGGATLQSLPTAAVLVLEALRTVSGAPLMPAFAGYALSVSRDYSGVAPLIPLAQLTLTTGMLAIAVYSFNRRDLAFDAP